MHRTSRLLAVLAGAALLGSLVAGVPESAQAAAQTVTINMATNNGSPNYKGSGFLYGLSDDGSQPAGAVLSDLKPKLFRGGAVSIGCGWVQCGLSGYNTRFNSVLAQSNRAKGLGANYMILLSDMWNDGNAYPGDNGNWAPWTAFLTQLVQDKIANNMTNSRYDIWNEPDGTYFWPRTESQYQQMWIRAVQTIRSLDPNAVITGPGYANYNSTQLGAWLDFVKANNVIPNILDWHFGTDPVADVASAQSLLTSRGISVSTITIGEVLRQDTGQTLPGYSAWWLGRFQKSAASGTNHAIWANCCSSPYLDDLLTSTGAKTGAYNTYKAYADITGQLVGVTGSANIDGVAGKDSSASNSRILLGNNGGVTGDIAVNVTNLSSASYLVSGGTVHVAVQRNSDGVTSPVTTQSYNATVTNGATTITIPWTNASDSYNVILTAGGSVTTATTNDTGTGVVYSGAFGYSNARGFGDYSDDVHYTQANGDYATFTFSGTKVSLIGEKYSDQGNISVSIDGGAATTISTSSSSRLVQQTLFTSSTLASGTHSIRVAKSSGSYMTIDAFLVTQ